MRKMYELIKEVHSQFEKNRPLKVLCGALRIMTMKPTTINTVKFV